MIKPSLPRQFVKQPTKLRYVGTMEGVKFYDLMYPPLPGYSFLGHRFPTFSLDCLKTWGLV